MTHVPAGEEIMKPSVKVALSLIPMVVFVVVLVVLIAQMDHATSGSAEDTEASAVSTSADT